MGLSTEHHRNDMRWWPEITCQRGHTTHESTLVDVDLSVPHGYADLPPVPPSLARSFGMFVWDPSVHPVDGGPYCPAADAVSETIVRQRIWEPAETILTLTACKAAVPDLVVDFGAQVGWFSLLACSCELDVLAIEADAENVGLLRASAQANGWAGVIDVVHDRITEATETLPAGAIALAKIDVEGSEREAVRMLRPSIEAGAVDHLLIEVTPVFADYYGTMVADLVRDGYRAWRLPPKSIPPVRFATFPDDLEPWRISDLPRADLIALVDSWHQEMVWFSRPDAW